ncbi:hypothetical protein IKQ26_05860 [bacterium]|nr:hypothetical protein [bacterium]
MYFPATKKEINEAIYKVLTNNKKDALREHRLLENEGYTLTYYGNSWRVANSEEYVWKQDLRRYGVNTPFCFTKYRTIKLNPKIDFVNLLTSQKAENTENLKLSAKDKYADIEGCKYRIKVYSKHIENYKEEIEKLNQKINEYIDYIKSEEQDLENYRKEYGLTPKCS